MATVSEQHGKYKAGIQITHPKLNDGESFEITIEAPERVRDENGNLEKLTAAESLQQSIHGGIVRLFSQKWQGDYILDGYDRLQKDVIPALNQTYGVELTWKDNLRFRKFESAPDGSIIGSSCSQSGYNPETGEFDAESVWLSEADWMNQQALRDTPLNYIRHDDAEPVKTVGKKDEKLDLSFLMAETSNKKAKK